MMKHFLDGREPILMQLFLIIGSFGLSGEN